MQPKNRISKVASSRIPWLSAIIFFSCNLCFGQAPSGTFSFSFSPAETPLIDLTGTFQASQNIIGAGGAQIPLSFGVDVIHGPSGGIRAAGTTAIVQIGEDFVPALYTASGTVSGGGLRPIAVWLTVRMRGSGPIAGQETSFTIVETYRLTFNPEGGVLQGTARGTASFSRYGTALIRESAITVPVPSGVDGSWVATLNIVPFGRLAGTGVISLPNGRTLQGNLSGTFFRSSGISRITLTGTGQSRGANATFSTTPTENGLQLETVRGRVLGQWLIE